ncbi:serine/threonine-protein kinase [Streptomyces sp. NPDC002734]|uniref:serine/threonine-protein kinase n=1 Tax=Streptomyces sp. NPDC002734 TaxID=3154426 RepID=UPI00331C34FC
MRPVGSKYLLEEPIGRGATGTVWRARQRETAGAEAAVAGQPGETVAIKVLKEELANDPDVVMRFLRERSVLLRLTHDNIVRVRDLVVEGDLLALVMDLIEGPDLHRYLRENGPFSPVAASLLTAQIADALAASHADGVVHRDLKPANVLLRQTGGELHPMLTDFGIARLADSPGLTRTSEFVGTPSYVAPESAEGRPQTSAVDIYGAGILLYELVTGRPPFGGGSALEVLQQHLNAEPRRPSTLPEPLWTVIERCLRKNPDERPGAVGLARALRVVADGVGLRASSAQIVAADNVGALLAPDPAPAPVPGTPQPAGASEPTQVLPHGQGQGFGQGGAYDPNAATTVMQHPPGGSGGDADPTQMMPPQGAGAGPEQPHPWQTQLSAARERNEQTQVQQYVHPDDDSGDPLRRRRPQRQVAPRPQQPPRSQQQQYGYPPQHQQPVQRPAPRPVQRPAQRPVQPQPQRYAAPPQQPPAAPRERRRSANPVRIPGLGCLKGCLIMIVVFFVAGWLVWELSPLQEWIGTGKGWWDQLTTWMGDISDWFTSIGDTAKDVQNGVDDVQKGVGDAQDALP